MWTELISIVKPTIYTNVSNLFYFGMTFYMFRTVFPSIIGCSRLYIQQQAFVKQMLLSACRHILHVSDGLSVHHRVFKTVHTATGICQTDATVCLQTAASESICNTSKSWIHVWIIFGPFVTRRLQKLRCYYSRGMSIPNNLWSCLVT